mmetsp:Transcript_3676/g.8058  ORF Transcript_3676/g.8058 Transcript_3676/m.8058 type:complete len:287 (-) Transcript_3676:915-1775(-)|eukprot:CAMPEP_0171486156 /NCGR_PEP_ID=MMETSP0958-20121227/937_1 /TAXON_ID=87120 /ORGANISM="Aurantiochytrium limacinum, Strain ATCCMYA-1381" /LENGTH=286 /DNA_ID=CAMNT_0012019011 /DNA_START=417 /DNA_END=1277 /DNA_ORIENTATION=-
MRRSIFASRKAKREEKERIERARRMSEATEQEPRPVVPDGFTTPALPSDWASKRGSRRSLSRRSMSGISQHSDNSPTRSVASMVSKASKVSRASKADFEDVFDPDAEDDIAHGEVNPDEEHLMEADDADYDEYNLPRPGEKVTRTKSQRSKLALSRRLSTGLNKLVGGRSSTASRRDAAEELEKRSSLQRRISMSSKRLSLRKPMDPEKLAEKEAEKAAKRESKSLAKARKSYERQRAKDIKKNPWYPAGVDFSYLSPQSNWFPYLGRQNDNNDFGDETRLVGVVL